MDTTTAVVCLAALFVLLVASAVHRRADVRAVARYTGGDCTANVSSHACLLSTHWRGGRHHLRQAETGTSCRMISGHARSREQRATANRPDGWPRAPGEAPATRPARRYWPADSPFVAVTVTSGFSFRKLFSPTPRTFIRSSIFLQRIVRPMSIDVNRACAHQVRPPRPRFDTTVRRRSTGLHRSPAATSESIVHSGHVAPDESKRGAAWMSLNPSV